MDPFSKDSENIPTSKQFKEPAAPMKTEKSWQPQEASEMTPGTGTKIENTQ